LTIEMNNKRLRAELKQRIDDRKAFASLPRKTIAGPRKTFHSRAA